jgi:hypothetical protein
MVKDRRLAAHGVCAAAEFKGVRHRELQVTKDKFQEK